MMFAALLLQGVAPPPPPKPAPAQPAVEWSCRLLSPDGRASMVRGTFAAITPPPRTFDILLMTRVTVTADDWGLLSGQRAAGLYWRDKKHYMFAVRGSDATLNVSFEYFPQHNNAVMAVTRTSHTIPAAFAAVGIGYCEARSVARGEAR